MFVSILHCSTDGKKNSSQKKYKMAWAGKQARVKMGMSYFPLMGSFHNALASRVTVGGTLPDFHLALEKKIDIIIHIQV